ncbi:hypothetical protein V6N13_129008 [Hibiscus sabdariffa]
MNSTLKLIVLQNLVILLTQIDGRKACYEEERKGLLELKSYFKLHAVNGSEHALLPSWVDEPNNDCCAWERVTCNSTTGRVVVLSLSNVPEYDLVNTSFRCFDGAGSSSYLNINLFRSFEELKALNLSYNCIKWIENQGLLRLQKLETLDLSFNRLTSADIVRFLGSLPSLKSLDLSFNGMRGSLSNQDLIGFGRLEVLDLSQNQLEGGVPQNIGKLSSLKALYLAYNQFNSSLPIPDLHDNLFRGLFTPNSIRRQKFLQFIDISNNYFEGSFSLSSIFNHSELEVLILESKENKLQIDIDDQAGIPLFQLKALRLSNCNMKNAQFLLNQHRLTWVDISHNKFIGAFPSWLLQNNTDLRFLNLRNNSFFGKLDLPLWSNMGHLDVSYNYIEGHLPKDLGLILPYLHCLNLSYNSIEGELPSSIGAMRNLLVLDLSFNDLSGEVPKELAKNCTKLLGLVLNNNNFHGEFFSTQFNLSNIRLLRLGNNGFTGSLMTKKEFYSRMKIFDVSNNNMTGTIPKELAAEIILLQNNFFEGQIPCEGFFGAGVIDISHNFLSGPIPSCLSPENLSHVLVLNLRGNRLSGNIPARIGLLPSLRILLLGNNRFDGSIPRQLCRLRNISIMDLSNNSFSGSIPSCLSNISFGNDSHDSFEDLTVSYLLGSLTAHFGSANPLQELYDSTSLWDVVVLGDELEVLDLSENDFSGSLPVRGLCELRRLQVLDMHNNSFEGTLPPCLSNLTSLKILDLHDNLLGGSIAPNSIPSQQFLRLLDISKNDFEGSFSLSSLFNHSMLEAVALGSRGGKLQIDNGNQAGLPLFQLKALRLSNCNMKNAPYFLLNQHSLTWVDVSQSMLSGALPSWLLENNTDLKFLNLRNNSFTGKLDPLPQHPISAMVHMDVSYNYIDGHLPKDFGTMLPNLEYLNLSYNFFEGEVPKELANNCSDLVGLMLNNNNFHGEFFSTNFNSSSIQVLKLGNNQFTGNLIPIGEFYNGMMIFDVSNNNMTGKIPNAIDAVVLLLQNNSFQGQIPCEAFHYSEVIDISHNLLSGPMPSCLLAEDFAQVSLLNLRNNRLSGNILALISLLPSMLKILLLGNNLFSGLIPRQLCLLREISIMDLSNNSLSGSLPSCLSDIAFGNSHDFSVEIMFPTNWFRFS